MEINGIYDFFCIDCGEVTKQRYKGIYVDGSCLYICQECWCENPEQLDNNCDVKI